MCITIDSGLPDAGEGVCCLGNVMRGPGGCTCWEATYDQEQAEPLVGPANARRSMCHDCAFRVDSPERSGDEEYSHSGEGELEYIVQSSATFHCHQGMRRKLTMVHRPTGIVHVIPVDAYGTTNGGAFQADGTPAEICAGLAAARGWLVDQ